MLEDDSIGARIKKVRNLRGWTQVKLANEAGVTLSMLSKVESGHASPSSAWIGQVAHGLRTDATQLLGTEDSPEQLHQAIPILRRALASVDLLDDDVDPIEPKVLQAQISKVNLWRRETQYSKIGQVLPDLLSQLLVAAPAEGERVYAMLVDAYRAANTLSHKLGYSDLSMTATDRMVWAAERSGDPLLLGTVHYVQAATLSRIGAGKKAMTLLQRSATEIQPLISNSTTAAAVYTTLHMRAGTIAATLGDGMLSESHLGEAEEVASPLGDGVVYETTVGPTNVMLYKLCAAVDLGNVGKALGVARDTHLPADMAKERRTHFWIDAARAHLLAGDTDAAIEDLYQSRAASPEHFRSSRIVKSTIKTAATQQRRASNGLRALANYAGIAD